jgi:hypothetical protein
MFAQRAPFSAMVNDSAAPPAPSSSAPSAPATQAPAIVDNGFFSRRSMQQFSIFAAGAGFLFFSTMVTRRSIARKKLASLPKFYSPSHAAAGKQGNPEGNLIALEALNLATLNVMSAGIMTMGGIAWAFDLSSIEDLRERTRRTLHGEAGNIDEKAEREFEEWAAKILTQFGKTAPEDGAQDKPKEDKKN